ncbi:LysR substrate-binding domain-containing protein [Stappia indica]|uniref:LysR family transcriptional regulator, nitrogen assimilation regulatory protein n=1 Tax=Stappia indica TaxID=538381 RepID=A0A285TMK5_9HYPH|nr:LysR substrate-binding domain-containing protein [Stappia indica]MCC4246940.1 LysR family transcriptional regulator [Stappia indica]SOC23753.1 LysR family transcriptional regulator, nitrogen assimilation regulatory protein [Stappia indica]
METKRLEYFLRIVDCGSISRAAQDLGLAQPALSQQLAILEGELKVQLMYRSRRGTTPTAAGWQLYQRARIFLRQLEQTRASLLEADDQLSGSVSIGLPTSTATIISVPLMQRVLARYPQIRLHVIEGYSSMLTEMTQSGRLDVAVLFFNSQMSGLSIEPLWEEELLLVCPPDTQQTGPVPLRMLADVPLLLPSKANSSRRSLDAALAANRMGVVPIAEIDSIVTLKKAVQDRFAYTLLPWSAISEEVESGRLTACAIEGAPVSRTVSLCFPDAVHRTPAHEKIAEIIREQSDIAFESRRLVGMRRIAA